MNVGVTRLRTVAELGDRVLVLPVVYYASGPGPSNARKRRMTDGNEGRGVVELVAPPGGLDLCVSVRLEDGRLVEVNRERVRILRGKAPRKVTP